MPGWKEYRGGATLCTLTSAITAASTSFQINGVVGGWPTGIRPFVITIDVNTAREERVLCSALEGANPATLTVEQRGYDGTSAVDHDPNSAVTHSWDADSADTFGSHTFDTTRDDHTQYVPISGARGFESLDNVAGTPVAVGTANDGGTADTVARSDHVHKIGTEAIDLSGMFTPGVVDETAIAGGAVGPDQIAAAALGGGLTGGDGVAVAVNPDGGTITLAGGKVAQKYAYCQVSRASAQTIASPPNTIDLTTKDWAFGDPWAGIDLAANTVAPPFPGIWLISIEGTYTGSSLGTTRTLNLVGSTLGTVFNDQRPPAGASATTLSKSRRVNVPAAEAFHVTADHDIGAGSNISAIYLQFEYLGPAA